MLKLLIPVLTLLCASASAYAERNSANCQSPDVCHLHGCPAERDLPRPVTGIYSIEIGTSSAYSRYLAPVTYSGTNYAISGRWSKAMPFAPQHVMMNFDARVDFSLSLLNPRKNTSMQEASLNFAWTMGGYWRLPKRMTIGVAGGIDLEAGGLALLKNSNNPAAPNLGAAICAEVFGSWRWRIGKVPAIIGVSLRTPLLGAFYMNGFGETYYEIYLGNRSGLVHCGWPGNRQKFDTRLNLKLDLGRTAMEIGYRFGFNRAEANNLVYKLQSHSFTIGVIPGGLGLKRPRLQNRPGID